MLLRAPNHQAACSNSSPIDFTLSPSDIVSSYSLVRWTTGKPDPENYFSVQFWKEFKICHSVYTSVLLVITGRSPSSIRCTRNVQALKILTNKCICVRFLSDFCYCQGTARVGPDPGVYATPSSAFSASSRGRANSKLKIETVQDKANEKWPEPPTHKPATGHQRSNLFEFMALARASPFLLTFLQVSSF